MAPPPSHADHMRAVHREAAGVVTLDVVLRTDMPDLIGDALLGGQLSAIALLNAVNRALACITYAPEDAPKVCGTCTRSLDNFEFSIVIATPARDDAENALALAVCHQCGTTREAVRDKAIVALRDIWPDSRPITITDPAGGRA